MFTSTMTLTLDFQGQILKKSYLRNGMADWYGTKGMWVDGMSVFMKNFYGSSDICPMGFIYSIQICEISHQTFGPSHRKCPTCPMIFVNTGMLDSHCDLKLWLHPWPWPWIFKVKYWNCCNLGIGGSTHLEWNGCELDMMLDAQWDWPWATVHGK